MTEKLMNSLLARRSRERELPATPGAFWGDCMKVVHFNWEELNSSSQSYLFPGLCRSGEGPRAQSLPRGKSEASRKEGKKPTKVFSVQRLVKTWSIQFSDNSAGHESDLGSGHFLNQAFKMTTALTTTVNASLCETLSQKAQLSCIQIPDLQTLLEKKKKNCFLP